MAFIIIEPAYKGVGGSGMGMGWGGVVAKAIIKKQDDTNSWV